ncbi:M23 family metallopeptidase [Lentibacillus sp. Marseille-P4043]|uniref:M23 family metallopeptidase n=1 Tax=Lentibacillus sp. Marseille-P4043 TaxID=2040293 RepID=UPI000D0B26C6|nr:M23 family metallopeptidase [Lentibacillus sp. Marseille-P4043]
MKEENNGASKNKWSRIFRKKWFFPAVYLTIAAVLLTVVLWYQNLDNQVQEAEDEQGITEDYADSPYDQEAETVVEQQEVVKMPVEKENLAEIVTKFFDYNADQEDQESALVLYNNRYYQSTGIDIAPSEDVEKFNVTAALSGSVTEVKEDPLLGNLVEISHKNEVTTYYASLGKVDVKAGDEVKQGDVIGTSGKNLFGKDKGVHVHFELRKDGKAVDPEAYFNQPVSKLDEATGTEESQADEGSDANDESEATEESSTEDESTDDESEATEESDAAGDADKTDDADSADKPDATEDSDATDSDKEKSTNNEDETDNQDSETDAMDENSTGLNPGSSNASENA